MLNLLIAGAVFIPKHFFNTIENVKVILSYRRLTATEFELTHHCRSVMYPPRSTLLGSLRRAVDHVAVPGISYLLSSALTLSDIPLHVHLG